MKIEAIESMALQERNDEEGQPTVLVPLEKYAEGSFTPASKDVVVRITPSN